MELKNVNITGDGSIGGGSYGKIRVVGNGKVLDKVQAESISIIGNADLQEVDAKEIKVFGNARFDGPIRGGYLKVSGAANASGALKVDSVVIFGQLKVRKGVEAEHFVSRGVVDIETLNAGKVEVTPEGLCRIKEIGAESIQVSYKGVMGFFHSLFGNRSCQLRVDTIEADRIYLERTTAKTVRGNVIEIGSGCRIDLVEYKDSISLNPNSKVEKTVQF